MQMQQSVFMRPTKTFIMLRFMQILSMKPGRRYFNFIMRNRGTVAETYGAFDDSLGGSVTDWNLEEPEKRIKFGSITILVNEPEEE